MSVCVQLISSLTIYNQLFISNHKPAGLSDTTISMSSEAISMTTTSTSTKTHRLNHQRHDAASSSGVTKFESYVSKYIWIYISMFWIYYTSKIQLFKYFWGKSSLFSKMNRQIGHVSGSFNVSFVVDRP